MLLRLKESLSEFREVLGRVIQATGKIPIPGYTHMRKAMPATIGMWLGSFDEAAVDDLRILESVFKVIDQSPLGTAAGFGTPVYRLDRRMTAKELGFSSVQKNPLYAQFSRGKFETIIMALFSGVMLTLNKLATDLLIFSMDEFAFIVLPDAFCTGSSIMPHKKNPDVLELIRANYSVVLGEEFKIKSLAANLMSGYNRDMQLSKKPLFLSYDTVLTCVDMMSLILSGLQVDEEKCIAALTEDLFATEEAYTLVKKGMPFRDAYRKVAEKYIK
jgi:argininosuccinate lyase